MKLKVQVIERTTHDGRKFNTYRTFSKNGRATDLKFRKEVTNLPTKNCFIEVAPEDINLNTSGEYPVAWVKAIKSIEDIETVTAESNLAKVTAYFGE